MYRQYIIRESVNRGFDILLASVGLLVLGPLMLLIAAAIVLESGRPIFFSQTRLGRGGRHFKMYKFRKFGPREGTSGLPLTLKDDVRLSRVGRILAVTKFDELPQLYNILRGDMAVVGPRPESLAFADCFTEAHRAILDFKPGIFGPGQVAFRSEATMYPPGADPTKFYREVLFPHKADLDLSYYPHRSLIADINWIIRGVLAVFGLSLKSPRISSDLSTKIAQRSGSKPPRPVTSVGALRAIGGRERARSILDQSNVNPQNG